MRTWTRSCARSRIMADEPRVEITKTAGRRIRDVALIFPDEPLCCPRGHRVPRHFWALGETPQGGYRCTFRPPPGLVACNLGVFLLPLEGGVKIVVDVSSRELHEMEQRRMSLRQMRDFLGLAWIIQASGQS